MIDKVYAYITKDSRLLVFEHVDFPKAGVQVPGGTAHDGEDLTAAVLREATEESGLAGFETCTYLGTDLYSFESQHGVQTNRRHFFHLTYTGETPPTWRHFEEDPSDGSPGPIEFEFRWATFPGGVPHLSGDQGALLPGLRVDAGSSPYPSS